MGLLIIDNNWTIIITNIWEQSCIVGIITREQVQDYLMQYAALCNVNRAMRNRRQCRLNDRINFLIATSVVYKEEIWKEIMSS